MCVSSPHANVGVAYKKLLFNNLFNCLHVCLFNFNLFISYHNYNNFYITASEDDTHKDVTKYQEKNKKQQPTFVPIQSTCSLHTEVHTKTIYLKQVTKDVENTYLEFILNTVLVLVWVGVGSGM